MCSNSRIKPATLWFAACTQSTEPHQPGLKRHILNINFTSYFLLFKKTWLLENLKLHRWLPLYFYLELLYTTKFNLTLKGNFKLNMSKIDNKFFPLLFSYKSTSYSVLLFLPAPQPETWSLILPPSSPLFPHHHQAYLQTLVVLWASSFWIQLTSHCPTLATTISLFPSMLLSSSFYIRLTECSLFPVVLFKIFWWHPTVLHLNQKRFFLIQSHDSTLHPLMSRNYFNCSKCSTILHILQLRFRHHFMHFLHSQKLLGVPQVLRTLPPETLGASVLSGRLAVSSARRLALRGTRLCLSCQSVTSSA